MIARLSLSQRLSLVFAALLLACCGISVALQMRASERHEQEVVQRLSGGLAAHIAGYPALMQPQGLNAGAVRELFDKLMAVNPSVEVYLLDADGRIAAHAAPPGHVKRERVDLAPVRQLLQGAMLPVLGDDPRSVGGRKVFSAAPLQSQGRDAGYVYVILQGEDRETLAASLGASSALRTLLWSTALVALLGLVAGLVAFRLITRPLRALTAAVRSLEPDGIEAAWPQAEPLLERAGRGGGEIGELAQSFARLARRTAEQWQALRAQDQQRRELFANLSHDLRTPLTSLHGYLETLRMKADLLAPDERRRYLDIALDQSRKVGRLAQELFELARLEYGVVKPELERFGLPDLVQDVFQKFELAAEARRQRLVADIAPGLPAVTADVAMLERVLVNLLDNAVRSTPEGGEIVVQLRASGGGVQVTVSDTGPGVPAALRAGLFERPAFTGLAAPAGGRSGGLGLMIVHRILQLHGSRIELLQQPQRGAVFRFALG
ncbi:sensor histidine kinase [Comamonas humi]